MLQKKHLRQLVLAAVLVGLLVFFLEPRQAYIAKILYALVLAGFGIYHYLLQNRRGAIMAGVGTVLLLLTLPGIRLLSEVSVLMALLGWAVLAYLAKRQE